MSKGISGTLFDEISFDLGLSDRRFELARTVKASFVTRDAVDLAVEHLVQENGVDRGAVSVLAEGAANSSGTRSSGADLNRRATGEATGAPELAGAISVSATIDDHLYEQVRSSLEAYGGHLVAA